jgi:uncharacterized membrane protein
MQDTFLKRGWFFIQNIFLSGLIAILPITLTVALVTFSFKLLKSWLKPIYNIEPDVLHKIPHSEIFLVIGVILLIGFVLRVFLLQPILHLFEKLLEKIPLLSQVYFGIKQLVHAFGAQDTLSFQKVVIVEFPIAGVYSIGFVTGEVASSLSPEVGKHFYNVFVPTTPNPTTGYYVMIPVEQCKISNMTRQEAMALVISGGIIQPNM